MAAPTMWREGEGEGRGAGYLGMGGGWARAAWPGPSCSAAALHLCDLQLAALPCPGQREDQPANQPAGPAKTQDSPGAPAGGAPFFFFSSFHFPSLFPSRSPHQGLMGWEICERWQAGIIQDKRACDVLRFSLVPNSRIARPAWASAISGALLGT